MTKNFALVAYSRDSAPQQKTRRRFPIFRCASSSFRGSWFAYFTPHTNDGPRQLRYHVMRTRGRWITKRKKLIGVGAVVPQDRSLGSNGGDTFLFDAKSTTGDDRALGGQRRPTLGDLDSEPDVVVRDTQDVWSSPCPLFSGLISSSGRGI